MSIIRRKRFNGVTVGADGSAVYVEQWTPGRPGVVRAVAVDYQNEPATTDVVLKADSSSGATILTVTSSNTDIPLKPVGMPGIDEGNAAIAATDGTDGGFPFLSGLYLDIAQGDQQTSGNELVVVDILYEVLKRKTITISPAGADGAAVATLLWGLGRPGVVRFIKVDYQNQPATTDLVIKANASDGPTVFTNTSSATDIALKPVGMPAIDEGAAATAATDATSGGWPFLSGLYFDVAEGDGQTTGDEKIVLDLLYEA